MEALMGSCYSYRQFCSLGPAPPRTPARPDPQVPKDRKLGPCSHGKIGAFYFYAEGSQDDPAFGFCEIELSLQRLAENKVRLELYCIAAGYHSARGVGGRTPLKVAGLAGGEILGRASWPFPNFIFSHTEPMEFAAVPELDAGRFAQIH